MENRGFKRILRCIEGVEVEVLGVVVLVGLLGVFVVVAAFGCEVGFVVGESSDVRLVIGCRE